MLWIFGGILIKKEKETTSKQQQNSLNHKHLPYLSLFDSINQIAYVADPYTYEVLYINKYFEELLGQNPVGKRCYEVFQKFRYPCDFCTNKKILKNKGKPYEWEYHNPVLDRDFLITDRIIKWYDGRDVRFEFAIDITELKQTKKQIENQAKLIDIVSDAIISTDSDFKIKSWNKAAEKIYGFKAKEAIGKHMKNRVDIKYIEENRKKVLDTLLKKGYWRGETLQKRKNEQWINVYSSVNCIKDKDGNFLGTVAVNRDITDRKKAEEKLLKSEERYKLAQRAAEIGSWDWNILTGELAWSDQIEPMFGFKKGRFGKTYEAFLDCIHPDDRQFVIDSINACLEKNKEYDIEHRIIWPDGSVHWVRETGDVIHDKDGKSIRMLGIVQEITDRKKNEQQINKLNESLWQYTIRLEAANKEVEAFSYSISHDLRAPLRSIDGFSQALIEDYSDKLDETGIDYLNRVRNASQRMDQLIDGMLQLSRLSRKEMHIEKVDMGELAKSIIAKFRKEDTSRNVDFKVQDALVTKGDKNLLQILLENLLGNAWKFTSKRSKAKIEFGKINKKNEIVFFIKDNGAGFDDKYIDKIFVPFQRLHDDEFPGDGIGLGIVSRIIHRHGGQIWAEGKVGKSAIFYFKLGERKT